MLFSVVISYIWTTCIVLHFLVIIYKLQRVARWCYGATSGVENTGVPTDLREATLLNSWFSKYDILTLNSSMLLVF